MMRKTRLLFIAVLVLFHIVSSIPAYACSGNFVDMTIADYVANAELIFVGTVTGSDNANPYDANYNITVEKYLKGEGSELVRITGFGTGGGDCLNTLKVGDKWIFYADKTTDGIWIANEDAATKDADVLYASYTQVYDAVEAPKAENQAEISRIVGHDPVAPYPAPVWDIVRLWTYTPAFRVAVVAGIPALLLAAFGVAALRRRRSMGKKKKNDE